MAEKYDDGIGVNILRWFATSSGTDGTFLHLGENEGFPDANLEILFESFSHQELMCAVRECIQKKSTGLTRELYRLQKLAISTVINTDKAEFSFSWVPYPQNTDYGLVTVRRTLSYQMLMKEYEHVRYMCETVGKGLGIFELDPVSGKSWLLFGTEEYSRLCTASIEELKQYGVPSVGRYIPEEDRRRAAKFMHQSMCSLTSWTIAPRIYRDGAYRFTRFAGYCTSGDNGTVLSSVIAEDFSDHAREIEKANVEKSASCMLRSFLSAVFDVSFYIDNQFRILDDSSKLEHFLGTRPKGLFLDSFLFSADQARFTTFMATRRKQEPTDIASMIRLRLCTGQQGVVIDVELFCSPNFIQSVDGLDYSSNVSTTCPSDSGTGPPPLTNGQPSEFLIGLRVLSDVAKNTPRLSEEPTGYLRIIRDIRFSLEHSSSLLDDWIVPNTELRVSPDSIEIQDSVVRKMVPEMQTPLRKSLDRREYISCTQLLNECEVGWDGTVSQMLLNSAKGESANDVRMMILEMVEKSTTDPFVVLEICILGLLSSISVDSEDGMSVDWLRRLFSQSLKIGNTLDGFPEIHLVMYYICVLWACFCKKHRRAEEAIAVLEHVVSDMKSYLVHYPECNVGKKLEFIARHNLTAEFLRTGNVFDALRLSSNMDLVLQTPELDVGGSLPFR